MFSNGKKMDNVMDPGIRMLDFNRRLEQEIANHANLAKSTHKFINPKFLTLKEL